MRRNRYPPPPAAGTLAAKIAQKQRQVDGLRQHVQMLEDEQRTFLYRLKMVFGIGTWSSARLYADLKTALMKAERDLAELKAQNQAQVESRGMTSFPVAMERLQKEIHSILSFLPNVEAGGLWGVASMFIGEPEFTRCTAKINIVKERARALLPSYIANMETQDRHSVTAELRKYESYRDELAADISRHQALIGNTPAAGFLTPLNEHRQFLQEICYKLRAVLDRGQQQTRVPRNRVEEEVNRITGVMRTIAGVNAEFDNLLREYPDHRDFLNRERRRVIDRLREER